MVSPERTDEKEAIMKLKWRKVTILEGVDDHDHPRAAIWPKGRYLPDSYFGVSLITGMDLFAGNLRRCKSILSGNLKPSLKRGEA